jgi:hypothetical protein
MAMVEGGMKCVKYLLFAFNLIFLVSPVWISFFFLFFFFLWEASIFSCSSLNIQFHSDIIVVQLHSVCTYIWIVLKSKVISSGKNHIDLCHSIFEIIFPIRNFSLHKVLALRYISNMLFSDAFSGWAGWALAQLEFGSSVNPIPTRVGRLCPPQYWLPTLIWKLNGISALGPRFHEKWKHFLPDLLFTDLKKDGKSRAKGTGNLSLKEFP